MGKHKLHYATTVATRGSLQPCLLQSCARGVKMHDCHQIVTKIGEKQAKTSKIQKVEKRAI
jgi:hypothetical protein